MKKKIFSISAGVFLLVLASLSCSLFSPGESDALKIGPDTLQDAQAGTPYNAEIAITNNDTPAGDIYISEGNLPPGLEMEKVQGEDAAKISGTPSAAGTYTFTVSVWCYGTNTSGQVGEKEYTIVVE